MKRKTAKQIVAFGLSMALAGSCVNYAPVFAAVKEKASVQYVAISQTTVGLKIGTLGKASCGGSTEVYNGYIADVLVELQQYDGGWETIQEWSDNDWDYANVDEDWYVEKGYKYRVKATHRSYNSSGTQLEKTTTYSKTVTY